MKFIGKIFKNKSVVTIISLAICLVLIFFAYRYRVNTAISAINVPIASTTLKGRDEITKDSFKTIKVAQSMITENVITNTDYLIGKYVNYNTFIPEGSLFYDSAVVEWSHMPDSAWSSIKDDETVVSLKVGVLDTQGNSVFPGKKIDLYYQIDDQNQKMNLGPLFEGIEVLAVKDENGKHLFKKSSEQTMPSALIFAVSEEDFSIFIRASYVGGTILPVLRNSSYNQQTTLVKSQVKEIIEANSVELKPDLLPDEKVANDDTKVTE